MFRSILSQFFIVKYYYIACVSLLNRKLLMICDVEVDSWGQEEEPAPQQKDCSSCGVFALKVK